MYVVSNVHALQTFLIVNFFHLPDVVLVALTGRLNYSVAFYISLILRSISALFRQ